MKEGALEHQEKVTLYSQAELLRQKYIHTKDLVLAIGAFLLSSPQRHKPSSIIESRFTPPEEAFEKGMLSCGAIANMSAAMLRHVGLEVKLIHGEFDGSPTHAWISVLDPETQQWTDYDLTRKDPLHMPTHREKARVDSWTEAQDHIDKGHQFWQAKKLPKD